MKPFVLYVVNMIKFVRSNEVEFFNLNHNFFLTLIFILS